MKFAFKILEHVGFGNHLRAARAEGGEVRHKEDLWQHTLLIMHHMPERKHTACEDDVRMLQKESESQELLFDLQLTSVVLCVLSHKAKNPVSIGYSQPL